jgi:hypothetical protein
VAAVSTNRFGHEGRHLALAGHEQAPGVLGGRGRERGGGLPQTAQVDGALAQGLGGDAGAAHGDAARLGAGVHDRHALAKVRGLRGALLAGGAGADDDEIVVGVH